MTVSGININNYQLQYQQLKAETEATDSGTQRQEIAAIATPAAAPAPQQQDETSKQQEAFLTQLMEQMLANRIGLDKQKYDEIKEKIAEAEAEIDSLKLQPQSQERDNRIAVLEAKLEKLGKALEGLVAEANRNREAKEREQQSINAVQQYQRTAQADIVGTNTDKKPPLF